MLGNLGNIKAATWVRMTPPACLPRGGRTSTPGSRPRSRNWSSAPRVGCRPREAGEAWKVHATNEDEFFMRKPLSKKALSLWVERPFRTTACVLKILNLYFKDSYIEERIGLPFATTTTTYKYYAPTTTTVVIIADRYHHLLLLCAAPMRTRTDVHVVCSIK